MSASLTVDSREFDEAVTACLRSTRREASVALNSRGIHLGKKAIQETPVADARKIEYQLGVEGYKFRLNKSGKIVKRSKQAMIRKDSFAERIIRKRDSILGHPRKTAEEIVAAVKKLISSRKSSVGFIKQGWIDSVVDLAAKIGIGSGLRKGRRATKKGRAIPAQNGRDFMTVEITNTALLEENNLGSKGDPMRVAVPALQRAMDRETKEMQDHLVKKLQDSFNKNSARKV